MFYCQLNEFSWECPTTLGNYLQYLHSGQLFKPSTLWSILSHIKSLYLAITKIDPTDKNPSIDKYLNRWKSGYKPVKAKAHTVSNITKWINNKEYPLKDTYKKCCYLFNTFTLARNEEITFMKCGDVIKEIDPETGGWRLAVTMGRCKTGELKYEQHFIFTNPMIIKCYDEYVSFLPQEFLSKSDNRLWQHLSNKGKPTGPVGHNMISELSKEIAIFVGMPPEQVKCYTGCLIFKYNI